MKVLLLADRRFDLAKHLVKDRSIVESTANNDSVNSSDVGDVCERIRVEQHHVGTLANVYGPLLFFSAEEPRWIDRRGLKRLKR